MPKPWLQPEKVEHIRAFVHGELCQRNQLEPYAYHMTEKAVVKQGKLCGLFFCIHGPRSVRLTAVWELSSETVILYDSLGRRSGVQALPAALA